MVKTALKLLLVFVEYTESNATLLIKAVDVVDGKRGEASAPSAGGFSQPTVWNAAGCTEGHGGEPHVTLFQLHLMLKEVIT